MTIDNLTGYKPTWCPGCGNWGIYTALKNALTKLKLSADKILVSFGIGCSGNMNDFLNAYAIHALHGRSIPMAIGMKIARPDMTVIAVVGDGDCYGEGGNHLLHALRGNHDLTVIVHNNSVYGLTTGQTAPTARQGYRSKSTPLGIIERPLNPLSLALTQGVSFLAQASAGNVVNATEIITQAIKHQGLSLVNFLQPCVTFNKVYTYDYFKQHTYLLERDYNYRDYNLALQKAEEYSQEKFALGVIYQEKRPTYTDYLNKLTQTKKALDYHLLLQEFS